MNNSTSESDEVLLKPSPVKPLSSLYIGIIIISVVAGISLIGLAFLLVRRRSYHQKNEQDIETSSSPPTSKNKKRVFSFSSSNTEKQTKDVPVTSSLDNHDVFSTLLEYPPSKPPTSLQNNRLLEVPTANTTCSSYSVYEDRRKLLNLSDPISASLARQSIEERSGYYKSPTRTPVPYYHHKKQSSIASSSSNSNKLVMNTMNDGDDDEDKKAMQRWSASSYHVW